MLTTLLPHYTYRRLVVRLLFNWVRGKDTLAPRLRRKNFEAWRRFGRLRLLCNVCGHLGRPFFDFPDLDLRQAHRIGEVRETVQCTHCGATMRLRFLAHPLLERIAQAVGRPVPTVKAALGSGLGGLRILDTDAYSPISKLLRAAPGYEVSSYRPDRPMNSMLGPNHIQLAGAFVHLQKNRLRPAVALFNLAEANLRQYPRVHEQLNLTAVLALIADWRGRIDRAAFSENPLPTAIPPQLLPGD
jgi:hypothetical protein